MKGAILKATVDGYEKATGMFYCGSCRQDRPVAEKTKRGKYRVLCTACKKRERKFT